MSVLPDLAARTTALTAIDRSLLVEAGAGSGKTSVMAGRVAVLFANGVEPKHIAAITFTEFAASDLRLRIEQFATTLSRGDIPRDLEHLLPKGITLEQKEKVEHACKAIDQLACTTIHGFAQALLKPYPAEARIDPGAEIVDPAEADLAFEERYESWLKQQLSGNGDDGIVEALILGDEAGGLKLVSEVAQFLRRNRDARPAAAAWSHDTVKRFGAAAAQFKEGFSKIDYREEHTEAACRSFIELYELLGGLALQQAKPSDHDLVAAINLPRPEICFRKDGNRRKLQTSGKWQSAAAAAGRSRADGRCAYDALNGHYESCHDELEALLAAVAGELLARLAAETQGLMQDWHEYKRAAALLDFDDLLYTARDLLIGHDDVRRALSQRYRHVLVDEFQDTDPLQIEILWLLCGERSGGSKTKPLTRTLRPGALFLVGDPKQAIYRFRGADVNAYVDARKAIGQGSLLKITTNFRSVEPILTFVNRCFENVLSEAAGQPGFSELSPVRKVSDKEIAVAALDVAVAADKPDAAAIRDAEADCVANLCSRLVGNWQVQDHETSKLRPCRYGDIALLAPVGTELWRFEEALEGHGIPVSTQAGKGFFHRQEVQDLIALTRALADIRDTLALGALLRGPLVGLTEAELLDIADGLPPDPDTGRLPMLSLWTNPSQVTHETARSVLSNLQSLRRRARTTTPYILLTDAIAALHVRPQLRQRFKGGPERAIANVDLFLEMARAYDVRGLRFFAHDMRSNWEEAVRQAEGRPDAEQESVSLITVHASKGLEWPVVIPINMTGVPRSESALVQDRRANVFSIPVLGTEPSGHEVIKTRNEHEQARERVRLWYVAATRARDLLVLPRHSAKPPDECWAHIVDLGLSDLDGIDLAQLGEGRTPPAWTRENQQTREVFAEQAGRICLPDPDDLIGVPAQSFDVARDAVVGIVAPHHYRQMGVLVPDGLMPVGPTPICNRIANARHTIVWQRPSRGEIQAEAPTEPVPFLGNPPEAGDAAEIPALAVAGSSTRGILLHKLMEEVLLGETDDGGAYLERRARELLAQRGIEPVDDPRSGIAPAELAATVVRTLTLPEIQQLRPRLLPELPIFGHQDAGDSEILISGIADAVALDEAGGTAAVIDWKSDTDASPKLIEHYRRQIDDYRKRTGAKRALIVMMTSGKTIEIT